MIVSMGIDFDGKCAICREWIECLGDPWTTLDHDTDAGHCIAHWVCATGGEHEPDGSRLYEEAT